MTQLTPLARTVDALLTQTIGETLLEFISNRRADNKSYRVIAFDLYETTNRAVNVTEVTLRNWEDAFRQEEVAS